MVRTLTSKKEGPCPYCPHGIRLGDKIRWSPGKGAWHLDCERAKWAHDAADCRSRYLDALLRLGDAFKDAPEVEAKLGAAADGERVCVRAGFPSWSQIVYFRDGKALLWTAGSSYPPAPSTVRALPLTEELAALAKAAEFVPPPGSY